MPVKIKNVTHYTVEELTKKIPMSEEDIRYCLKEGTLKGTIFVSEIDLKAFLEERKKQKEISERLKKRASSRKNGISFSPAYDGDVFGDSDNRRIEL